MAEFILVNPHYRKGHTMARKHHRRHRRHHTRGFSRNPSLRSLGGNLRSTAEAGAFGAGGAIALDVLYGKLAQYLPASIAGNEWGALAIKAVGAVGVGMIGGKVLRGRGSQMATGAMTVVLHEAVKKILAQNFPALGLSEYLAYAPGSGMPAGVLDGLPDISSLGNESSFGTNTLNEYMTTEMNF